MKWGMPYTMHIAVDDAFVMKVAQSESDLVQL